MIYNIMEPLVTHDLHGCYIMFLGLEFDSNNGVLRSLNNSPEHQKHLPNLNYVKWEFWTSYVMNYFLFSSGEKKCFDSVHECIGTSTYCKTQKAIEFDWRTAPTTESSIWYVNVHFISWKILNLTIWRDLKIKNSFSFMTNKYILIC